MGFQERLRELRLSKGMTQKDLGKALHLGGTAISNYELGITQPSIETLLDMSRVLNVSMDYLLGVDVERKSPLEKCFYRLSVRRQREMLRLMRRFYVLEYKREKAAAAAKAEAAKKAAEAEKNIDSDA